MKKFIQLLVVATVATTGNIYAQGIYSGDAIRFSRTDYGSSARFKGLGNAQTSLGGDISSIGGNPAGLGMFTRSEFSITPEFNNIQANTNFLGQNTKSNKNPLNLNQAGAVWYNPIVRPQGSDLNKGILSVVWGIGYNRNNDFSINNNYSSNNAQQSITQDWAQQANGITPGNLDRGSISNLAFQSFLIDKAPGTTNQYLPSGIPNSQGASNIRTGSTSEFNFSGAMNISNQLYLGASIGFVNVRYQSDVLYTESGTVANNGGIVGAPNLEDQPNPHRGQSYDLAYRSNRSSDGSGIVGRLGLIYKPVDAVRVGATFQTPTWMHVETQKSEFLDTQFSGGDATNPALVQSDIIYSNFNYNLRTPYKGSFGASAVLGGNAIITADIDYVDYGTTKLSVSDGYANAILSENQYIKDTYGSAVNYRVGAEYRIDKFSIRGGYGVNGTPYKNDTKNTFQVKSYSGGIGYRVSQYYIDLAYVRQQTNYTDAPFELDDASEPIAASKLSKNNVFMTVGIRF